MKRIFIYTLFSLFFISCTNTYSPYVIVEMKGELLLFENTPRYQLGDECYILSIEHHDLSQVRTENFLISELRLHPPQVDSTGNGNYDYSYCSSAVIVGNMSTRDISEEYLQRCYQRK
jgi:hypothetical protein